MLPCSRIRKVRRWSLRSRISVCSSAELQLKETVANEAPLNAQQAVAEDGKSPTEEGQLRGTTIRTFQPAERIFSGDLLGALSRLATPRETFLMGFEGSELFGMIEGLLPRPLQVMQPVFNFLKEPFGGDPPLFIQRSRAIWNDAFSPIAMAAELDSDDIGVTELPQLGNYLYLAEEHPRRSDRQ